MADPRMAPLADQTPTGAARATIPTARPPALFLHPSTASTPSSRHRRTVSASPAASTAAPASAAAAETATSTTSSSAASLATPSPSSSPSLSPSSSRPPSPSSWPPLLHPSSRAASFSTLPPPPRRSRLGLSVSAPPSTTPPPIPIFVPDRPLSPKSVDPLVDHPRPCCDDIAARPSSRRKKRKKRRFGSISLASLIMDFPDRLRQVDAGDEDIRPSVSGNTAYMNLNQSIFGFIAAAGSRVNFNDRFEGHTSDDDDDADDADGAGDAGDAPDPNARRVSKSAAVRRGLTATTVLPAKKDKDTSGRRSSKDLTQSTIFTRHASTASTDSRRARFTDSKLLRSLPSLRTKLTAGKRRASKSSKAVLEEQDEDADADAEGEGENATSQGRTQSDATTSASDADVPPPSSTDDSPPPAIHVTRTDRSNSVRSIAPVMSRMLEAKAELAAARPSFDLETRRIVAVDRADSTRGGSGGGAGTDADADADTDAGGPSALARKLMEIFEFDKPEEVIEEYPCWLLQSVLLQGYMYITAHHICFYAYLPKKAHEVAKSGYLAKAGKRNPKYNRYWFRLKGDVLSYYRSPSNLYFPHGQIDLRYGISATVTDRDKDGLHFQVVTDHRTYYFRADSAPSAKEWVKSLQRVIFRSHNDGDSIKISLPIENVIDVEENQAMVEFTDTCKIRVIDNDETFAIDEYFFSFFDYGKEAVRILKILIDDSAQKQKQALLLQHQQQQQQQQQFSNYSFAAAQRLDLPTATQGGGVGGAGAGAGGSSADERVSTDSGGAFGPNQNLVYATGHARSATKPVRLQDSVRATLRAASPISSPRASTDIQRSSFDALRSSLGGGGGGGCSGSSANRRSLDLSQALSSPLRRSFSDRVGGAGRRSGAGRSVSIEGHRHASVAQLSPLQRPQQSQQSRQPMTDSAMQSSIDDPSQTSFSNLQASSSDEPSASQILHGSDIFQRTAVSGGGGDGGAPSSASAAKKPRRALRVATSDDNALKSQDARPPSTTRTGRAGRAGRTGRTAATTGHMGNDGEYVPSSTDGDDGEGDGFGYGSGNGGEVEGDSGLAQNLARLGTYPLQRAGAYAGWLNRTSRRMSSLLATESMGYVEKVSGMWKGGRQYYDDMALGAAHPGLDDPNGGVGGIGGGDMSPDAIVSNEHFREHFALPDTEKLQATYFGSMMRVLPLYGKIYISNRYFCFRSMLPGTRTKLILPLRDIENVTKEKGFRFRYAGLVVVIRGHEELFFEFSQTDMRDDCAGTLLHLLERARYVKDDVVDEEQAGVDAALAERDALQEAREEAAVAAVAAAAAQQDENRSGSPVQRAVTGSGADNTAATSTSDVTGRMAHQNHKVLRQSALMSEAPTILFDDPKASFLNFKPPEPLNITCLTIGSRGDVQPYIALGRGLVAEGHRVRIATHPEFEGWIRSHGLDYGRVEGDPGELMRICIENGTFTLQFLREASSKMRTWLDELLASAWTACQGAELLIESPSAMAGIHIAERLQIPYFRAFTMPWTRTRAYPHAFLMPERKMGGAYNHFSYTMFEAVFWRATASQINRWRNKTLGLRNTSIEKMQVNKVPFLYNFSPRVVPPPLDYSDWIRVTGYWFLDEGTPAAATAASSSTTPDRTVWTPPADLTAFIQRAKSDGKKLVYVGFGSIVVPDPAKMTQEVIDAVLKADVRCILSKGWSDRVVSKTGEGEASANAAAAKEASLPPEIFQIKSAPHDWLFAQIDAAAHHGGSGTTGASLRAGIPTIIRPFFGDQFFFGSRVEDLGVGICLKKWGAMSFARALWEATNSERMIRKAAVLGEQIREENGVDTAIQCIYRDMEYAKSLVKEKAAKNGMATDEGATPGAAGFDDDDVPEESWTFVGEDDPMQQSTILASPSSPPPPAAAAEERAARNKTPVAGAAASGNSNSNQGGGSSSSTGGYKALGNRILGMATAQR